MDQKFDKCIRKYEGCMEQLKKAESLLKNIKDSIITSAHLDKKPNLYSILDKITIYVLESKYNKLANERRDDENTRLQSKFEGDN